MEKNINRDYTEPVSKTAWFFDDLMQKEAIIPIEVTTIGGWSRPPENDDDWRHHVI